eukprot:CAMPEP_0206488018 /NCGR_PEP_ID=MMETSP0324_2-20121206/42091_1 /ASSEMBLY_ACC=CAM_ASM_000836 /TAXON_ID=2866 /ORGANISM="Crypthecodinium cohnii, Strain Seligo" /LENGTH=758 /DNA_ID=CAMNT_0053966819 /DNA_START=245 /DNA_END=2522 /DNA_ORIENTATION=-
MLLQSPPPQSVAGRPPLSRDMRQELEEWKRQKYEKLQRSQGSTKSPLSKSAKKASKRCSCQMGRSICGQSNCSAAVAPVTPSKERRGHVSAVSPLSEIRRSDPENEALRAANRCVQSMFLADQERLAVPGSPCTGGKDRASEARAGASRPAQAGAGTTSFSSSALATRSAAAFGLLAIIRPSPFEPTPYLARLLEASLAAAAADEVSGLLPKAVLSAYQNREHKEASCGKRGNTDFGRLQKDLFPTPGRARNEQSQRSFGLRTASPIQHGSPEDILDPTKQLMASAASATTHPPAPPSNSCSFNNCPAAAITKPVGSLKNSNDGSNLKSNTMGLRGARRNLFDDLASPEASPRESPKKNSQVRRSLEVEAGGSALGPSSGPARFLDLTPVSTVEATSISPASPPHHLLHSLHQHHHQHQHQQQHHENPPLWSIEPSDEVEASPSQDDGWPDFAAVDCRDMVEEEEEEIELLDLSDLVDNGGPRAVPQDVGKPHEDLASRSIGQVETEDRSSPDVEDDMNATTLDRSPSSSPSSSCSSSCCSSPRSGTAGAAAAAATATATTAAGSSSSSRGSRTLRRLRRQLLNHEVSWPQLTPLGVEDHLSRAYDLSMFWFFESRDRVACLLPDYADRPFLPLEEIAEYPSEWPAWKIRSFEMRNAIRAGRRKSKGNNVSTGTASDREGDEVDGNESEATMPPPRASEKATEAVPGRIKSPRNRGGFEGPPHRNANGNRQHGAPATAFGRSSGPRFASAAAAASGGG